MSIQINFIYKIKVQFIQIKNLLLLMMIILKEEMIIVFLKNLHNLVSLFYHFLFYLVNFGRRALVSNENKYEFRMGQVTPSPSKYGISSKFN